MIFNGAEIKGSPVENIDVLHGLVQARYSDLLDEQNVLVAGATTQWKIQAKDIFENVVLGTEERFSLEIRDMLVTDSELIHEAQIEYLFSLYSATFILDKASDYSAIVRLTQTGGLISTYYETTDFLAPIHDTSSISHTVSE